MEKPLVILMHGILRTRYSMSFLAYKLRAEGFETLLFGYRSLRADIEAHAELLFRHLEGRGMLQREIFFVTHSLGSIVARKFIARYGRGLKISRVIMLGPPNQGSSLARRLARFYPVRLIMGPSFLELCNLSVENPCEQTAVYIIAGKKALPVIGEESDGIVRIEETYLPGAREHVVIQGLHSFLMYNPGVIKKTIEFLKC